jgi:L-malate glycosyltransferase
MIRVCIVAPKWMTGGQAIEARTIVEGFASDPGVRVEMQPIDPRIPGWLARIRGVRTLARMPLFLGGLIVRILRSDVVHVCTAAYGPFVLTTSPAILLARLLGRPVILNYRDGRAPDHLRSPWVRWMVRRASLLVFPSGFLRDVFGRFGLEGEVVSNVVDTQRFRFRERRPLRPVLISSRLLETLYAVDNTIRAFRLVRQEVPDARLIVIGGGHQEQMLRDVVAEEGIEGVEFHGPVNHDEVAGWYDRADVFVNSSREDNMPHSIIEAFSSGLPVVTTGAGGIPYLVEHERNGLLIEPDRPDQMATAVLRVLRDPGLAEYLITTGRADCEAIYSWNAARRRWIRVYETMARRDVSSRIEVEAA